MLVADLLGSLDEQFPAANAASWDPVGLQLGDSSRDVGAVGVVHEITGDAVASAISAGVTTLVSYHPLLFTPVTAVTAGPTSSGRALQLMEAGVSVIVVHTALDSAQTGTGDVLLASLGINTAGRFAEAEDGSENHIGRYGQLPEEMSAAAFAVTVSEVLTSGVRMAGDKDAVVRTIAVVPGSGSAYVDEAVGIADVFVTGDVSHHRARAGSDHGLVVIDAGHIPTERPGVEYLYDSVRDLVSDAMFIACDPYPWEDVPWKT